MHWIWMSLLSLVLNLGAWSGMAALWAQSRALPSGGGGGRLNVRMQSAASPTRVNRPGRVLRPRVATREADADAPSDLPSLPPGVRTPLIIGGSFEPQSIAADDENATPLALDAPETEAILPAPAPGAPDEAPAPQPTPDVTPDATPEATPLETLPPGFFFRDDWPPLGAFPDITTFDDGTLAPYFPSADDFLGFGDSVPLTPFPGESPLTPESAPESTTDPTPVATPNATPLATAEPPFAPLGPAPQFPSMPGAPGGLPQNPDAANDELRLPDFFDLGFDQPTPQPTPNATPVATPVATPTPTPAATPSVTVAPTPNATSAATPKAAPVATAQPTPTPQPTVKSEPTPTPQPAPTPTPLPKPEEPPAPEAAKPEPKDASDKDASADGEADGKPKE